MADSKELKKWISVAEDLNENFELDPPLSTEDVSVKELKAEIGDENILSAVTGDEELKNSTFAALRELGWKAPKKSSKKTSKKEEPESAEESEETETETEEAPKKSSKKTSKKEVSEEAPKKSKTSSKESAAHARAAKASKGPGVIESLIKILTKAPKGGINIDGIVEKLTELFPDREPDCMRSTVKIQCSSRLKKDKGLKVESPSKGHYKIVA